LEIMREHRGFIGVKAGLPQGTTVRLLFPLADPPPPEPVLLVQPAAELPRGSETILLAEDDDGARRVVARMLQDQGYAVLEAENGAMAIRHMLGHGQKIHLLISDMMMPDFDGWALSEQVLGLQPGIRVIFISGYNAAEIEQKGVQLSGMTIPLLNKPFRREELLSLVRQVLDA
jgi:CheY-like chemotaxis protein